MSHTLILLATSSLSIAGCLYLMARPPRGCQRHPIVTVAVILSAYYLLTYSLMLAWPMPARPRSQAPAPPVRMSADFPGKSAPSGL